MTPAGGDHMGVFGAAAAGDYNAAAAAAAAYGQHQPYGYNQQQPQFTQWGDGGNRNNHVSTPLTSCTYYTSLIEATLEVAQSGHYILYFWE